MEALNPDKSDACRVRLMWDGGHEAEYHCPLAPVDRRLEDTHQLWHPAAQNYFDPNGFRIAAQNAIQTLRSVTFILQKQKNLIADFDQWYAPWQDRLKNDPVMRWLVDARNRIEKEGDLVSHSFVRAEIIASYLDEGLGFEIKAELSQGIESLLDAIPEDVLQKHVSKHGGVRIQRRWVDNRLPEYELLDALAITYGRIAEIIHDCHSHIGLPVPTIPYEDKQGVFDLKAMQWKMPCMIHHHDSRALFISFEDGSVLTFRKQSKVVDQDAARSVVERYGVDILSEMTPQPSGAEDIAANFFKVARRMFLKDGYHGSMVFLLRDGRPVKIIQTQVSDQFEKYLMMREIAREVAASGVDALFTINEAWIARIDELKPFERAGEAVNREEVLVVDWVSRYPPMQPLRCLSKSQGACSPTSSSMTTSDGRGARGFCGIGVDLVVLPD